MVTNKADFISSLSKEELEAGCYKFNIPNEETPYSLSGEGVWGWFSIEDRKDYEDDSYVGKLTAILLNSPLNYYGKLNYGDEVVIQCFDEGRGVLDPEWVEENI